MKCMTLTERTDARVVRTWLVAWLLIATLAGCSGFIVPPPAPAEPVSVYVLDHGQHSSLLIPDGDGATRYSYGDWNYYALGETSLASGLRALLVPTPAALGRQVIADVRDINAAFSRLHAGVVRSVEIRVEAALAQRLRETLDSQFMAAIASRHYSPAHDTDFVTHPRPYSLASNSNRVVGEWLVELGCRIQGQPVLSRWSLAADQPDRSPSGGH